MKNSKSLSNEPLERAAQYLIQSQNPETGGWSESNLHKDDTVTTAWVVLALRSATLIVDVDLAAFERAETWLKATRDEKSGECSRAPGTPRSHLATAAGQLAWQLASGDIDSDFVKAGRDSISKRPFSKQDYDAEETFLAAIFLHNTYKKYQKEWDDYHTKLRRYLIESQVKVDCEKGSYNPSAIKAGPQQRVRNRCEETCLSIFSLEIYYRYFHFIQDCEFGEEDE